MMTKEEALAKIKELEEYIENLDRQTGFENDEIFLLSTEEYEKYKDAIPIINTWWWLRSPGSLSNTATYVYFDGSGNYYGFDVCSSNSAVRPALRINGKSFEELYNGYKFIQHGYTWVKIGNNIAISEMPINFMRFDENSNDYENSEVRQFLLNWIKER